jgi:hypothetical protein
MQGTEASFAAYTNVQLPVNVQQREHDEQLVHPTVVRK